MKQRSTTPVSDSFAAKAASVACAILMAVAAPISLGQTVFANYDAQINAAQNEASQNAAQAAEIGKMADSLQAELNALEAQKNAIQAEIDKSQSRYDQYEKDIKISEGKIADNKSALGDTIADMYVDSDTSTLEMIASSKTIGDFVDKQAQQTSVQNKLNETIDKIDALKKQLEQQKQAVERELLNQKSQREQLAAKESEKAKLVEETRGQEDAYRAKASAKNAEVDRLRAAQAEENRRAAAAAAAAAAKSGGGNWSGSIPAGTPGGGGYPGVWANAPLDAYVDPWGLYTRECVSYVAWKIASTGRFVPHFGGAGNARQWPGTVAGYGIQSGSAPRAGAAAMWPIGYYGHVMYVESVNADGTITVSDYNLEWDGLYRQYTRSAAGLTYIYF